MRLLSAARPRAPRPWGFLLFLMAVSLAWEVRAADLEAAETMLRSGKYEEALKEGQQVGETEQRIEEWPIVRARALAALGRYPEARQVVTEALPHLGNAMRLRLLGYEILQQNGDEPGAAKLLEEIAQLA